MRLQHSCAWDKSNGWFLQPLHFIATEPVFQLDNLDNKRLFKLLKKAYVDARYKPSYVVTHEELLQLSKQVEELKRIGEFICHEKINNF